MRKLTDNDIQNIAGLTIEGYKVEQVRIKQGEFSDSDHYGYILAKNDKGRYVCWQFYLDENEKPTVYWGRCFMEDREAAIRDFNSRDLPCTPELNSEYWDCECDEKYIHPNTSDSCPRCGAIRTEQPDSHQNEVDAGTAFFEVTPGLHLFNVTITEELRKMVTVEAKDREQAEDIVSDHWYKGEYVLGSDDFTGRVNFNVTPMVE